MKAEQILLATALAVAATGASAQPHGLSREQVQLELRKDFDIRQELAHQKHIARQAGCDLDLATWEVNARFACNALIASIDQLEGDNAAAKVAAYKKLRNLQ